MRHKHLNKKVPLEQKAAPYLIYIELSTIDVIKKLTTNGSTVSTVLLKFAVFAELYFLCEKTAEILDIACFSGFVTEFLTANQ